MFGIPYVYTQSRILRARLEYLRDQFQVLKKPQTFTYSFIQAINKGTYLVRDLDSRERFPDIRRNAPRCSVSWPLHAWKN
jgi:hypothetical protein